MFGFLKKKKQQMIANSVKGQVVPITEVPDETFSSEILGKGFAVLPEDGNICAPVDGEITLIFDTKHALSMVTEWGAEILIHIGLETMMLKGEPFTVCVEANQKVKKGDLLVKADLDLIKQAELNPIVINVLCNSSEFSNIELNLTGQTRAGVDVMSVEV